MMAHLRSIALPRQTVLAPWVLLAVSMCMAVAVMGQRRLVDERDQAQGWFLPVRGTVMQDGERIKDYNLILYKDNKVVAPPHIDKKGRFHLELDIDAAYTVHISKPGYAQKIIYVDTSLPKDLVTYPDYEMTLGLIADASTSVDPFYSDFPSGIVRWNPEMEGFYHSEQYMAHIQSKLSGYATAQ